QSFRLITLLEPHRSDRGRHGLNLTRVTLAACSKYPWLRGNNPNKRDKWGAYDCDADTLDWAMREQSQNTLSLNAEIMDWADDVAYAVHDIEDFYRAGLIPLEDYVDSIADQPGTQSGGKIEEFWRYVRQSPVKDHYSESVRKAITKT